MKWYAYPLLGIQYFSCSHDHSRKRLVQLSSESGMIERRLLKIVASGTLSARASSSATSNSSSRPPYSPNFRAISCQTTWWSNQLITSTKWCLGGITKTQHPANSHQLSTALYWPQAQHSRPLPLSPTTFSLKICSSLWRDNREGTKSTLPPPPHHVGNFSPQSKPPPVGPGTNIMNRAPANVWNYPCRRTRLRHLTEAPPCVCGAGRDISFLYDSAT